MGGCATVVAFSLLLVLVLGLVTGGLPVAILLFAKTNNLKAIACLKTAISNEKLWL